MTQREQHTEQKPSAAQEVPPQEASWEIVSAGDHANIIAIQAYAPSRTLQILFWSIVLLLAAVVVWASLTTVNIAIHAPGTIRPLAGLQVFRSPFNAVLDTLYIADNQAVRAGDTLAVFATGEIVAQRSLTTIEQQRILDEIADIRHLTSLLPQHPYTNTTDSLPVAPSFRLQKYFAEYALIKKDIHILASQYNLLLAKSTRSNQLLKKNFSSVEEYETAEAEVQLQKLKIAQYVQDWERKLSTRLFEQEQQLSNVRKTAQSIDEQIKRCYIIANVHGTITGLKVQRAGLFYTAGQELFSISPEDELQAELYIHPRDAGLLQEQLPVTYYIEAFSYNDWEILKGKVQTVPNDITFDESTGQAYYKVLCSFNSQTLRYKKGKGSAFTASLRKGLPVQANIVIGQKKLLELLYDRTIDFLHFN